MGIFDAIRNNLRHKLNSAVEGVENRNVAAVYESAIEQAIQRVGEHKERIASLAVMRDQTQEELVAAEADLKQVMAGVQGAVSEGDDDTALVLLTRKEELTTTLTDKAQLLEQLTHQVEESKSNLIELRAGVDELKREKEVAVANHASAEARIEIQETLSGLSDKAHIKGLDSVREAIGRLESQAHEGYLDEDGNSIRGRAQALGKKASEASARAQLEALKRQHFGDDSDDSE